MPLRAMLVCVFVNQMNAERELYGTIGGSLSVFVDRPRSQQINDEYKFSYQMSSLIFLNINFFSSFSSTISSISRFLFSLTDLYYYYKNSFD